VRTGDVVDGRYELEDARGSGSGGIVWTAFDKKLKRAVALKRPHLMASQADRLRFRREAETAAQVHHPNAISVFDTVDDDECWLVMEYSPAESLDKVLAGAGRLPAERVARIGVQIAAALDAVHAKDIVHRDVKPGNILVDENDFAQLTDFGISLWREVTLTHDGRFSGTPAFAAPEVADGQRATAASDVFSLGATLFAAVEGVPPFGTGEPDEVLQHVRAGEIQPMAHAGPLAPLLSEMLSARPGKRPSAEVVRQRLAEIVGDHLPTLPATQPRARPFWRLPVYQLVAAGVVVVAVSAAVFLPESSSSQDPPSNTASTTDLIGDERTADPCSLLDRKAVAEFGPAQLHTTYGNFNRCDVLVDVSAKEPADVEIQLVTRKSHPVDGKPFEVVPEPEDPEACDRTFLVDEKYGIRVTVTLPNPPMDLCDIADVAVKTVRDTLSQGQLPRRGKPFPPDSLAHVDTCQLLDNAALAALPAVDTKSAVPGFGGWACKWYSMVDRTSINLRYDQHASEEPIAGEKARLGSHDAFVKLDTDSGTSCTVSVLHMPPNRTPRTTVDVMVLTVRGDRPGEEYCTTATALATAAAAKLPS
jgi:serine/threonine protein kinase